MSKKLAIWNKSYTSLGGRVTLIKVALENIPVYYMSMFKMACKVAEVLEKYQWDFLWEGGLGKKDHLIKWDDVCKPKKFGVWELEI